MGMPAARLGDMHLCPMATPAVVPIPHVGGPIMPPCCVTVLVSGQPLARLGDFAICTGGGIPDPIVTSSFVTMIQGQPAARMGDMCSHGGSIIMGAPTTLIG